MQPRKLEGIGDLVGPLRVQITETTSSENHDEVVATIATVVIVGIGAAVFEAALLPGIALGVAAMWLPRYYPTTV